MPRSSTCWYHSTGTVPGTYRKVIIIFFFLHKMFRYDHPDSTRDANKDAAHQVDRDSELPLLNKAFNSRLSEQVSLALLAANKDAYCYPHMMPPVK